MKCRLKVELTKNFTSIVFILKAKLTRMSHDTSMAAKFKRVPLDNSDKYKWAIEIGWVHLKVFKHMLGP